MFKKATIVFSLAMILCLAVSGLASARQSLPQWEVAFDPIDYGYTPVDYENWTGGAQTYNLVVFKEYMYTCIISTNGGQLYRTSDGKNWEATGQNGFGVDAIGCQDLFVFQDKLFFSTWYGRQIIRTADGVNFEIVSNGDEGSPIDGPRDFIEFKGMLYVTSTEDDDGFSDLWRSPSGDPGTWESAGDLGNNYIAGWALVSFKGMLYISLHDDWNENVKILRSPDGVQWEVVVADGWQSLLQDGTKNNGANIWVDGANLYAATYNWNYVDPENWITNGAQLYVTKNGVDWELVMQGGFGSPDNSNITGVIPYHGAVVAFTANGVTGCEAWMSVTGKPGTWIQVNEDGFGYGLRNGETDEQVVFKGDLYVAGFDYSEPRLMLIMKLPAQSHSMAMAELFPTSSIYLPVVLH